MGVAMVPPAGGPTVCCARMAGAASQLGLGCRLGPSTWLHTSMVRFLLCVLKYLPDRYQHDRSACISPRVGDPKLFLTRATNVAADATSQHSAQHHQESLLTIWWCHFIALRGVLLRVRQFWLRNRLGPHSFGASGRDCACLSGSYNPPGYCSCLEPLEGGR